MDRCTNCNKFFIYMSSATPILDVYLLEEIRHYKYCSEKCMKETVGKINSYDANPVEKVDITFFERLSKNPLLWKIVLRPINLHIRLLPQDR